MSILDIAGDDSRFFNLAFQDYRETTGDYSKFVDLHRTAQQVILRRAQQLKQTEQQKSRHPNWGHSCLQSVAYDNGVRKTA